jgi:hypothetical protein
MVPDDIAQAAWSVSARHLSRGQRDPLKMVAEAMMLERQRCLAIVIESCGKQCEAVRLISDPTT